jgi:hypothetical protein
MPQPRLISMLPKVTHESPLQGGMKLHPL